jgi:hypothetical protein
VRLDAGTTKNREGRVFPIYHRAAHGFDKSWKIACRAAGCPGRIPHDLRRMAIRNFIRSGTSEIERPQNAQRV